MTPNLYSYAWNNPTKWTDPSGQNSSIACAQGNRRGGACGSLAGLVNPILNAVTFLAVATETYLVSASILNPGHEITNDDRDVIPYPPPTCNLVGHNYPSTASPGQSTVPTTMFAQLNWVSILLVPGIGTPIGGANNDPRFCASDSLQKMQLDVTSSRGERVVFHYQFNPVLGMAGRVADIKIVHYEPGF